MKKKINTPHCPCCGKKETVEQDYHECPHCVCNMFTCTDCFNEFNEFGELF